MSGQETELDRSVIEQLSDPLIHLLRNAIDHGMESPEERVAAGKPRVGAISLSATAAENHILIEVRDDGRGIDGDKVKASAVAKGFLTRRGRGAPERARGAGARLRRRASPRPRPSPTSAGAVWAWISSKSTIERMGGHISIESTVGAGHDLRRHAAPHPGDHAGAAGLRGRRRLRAAAQHGDRDPQRRSTAELQMLQGTEATLLRGTILPMVRLREYFGCPPAPRGGHGADRGHAGRWAAAWAWPWTTSSASKRS